jgi:hypothetical protein
MRGFLLLSLLALLTGCRPDKTTQLENQNRKLAARLGPVSQGALFELQGRCAEQARKAFKDQGPWGVGVSATFANHYNQHLNKCFIEIHASSVGKKGTFTSIFVSDALEGEDYGEYSGVVTLPEVPPADCRVTSLSGEERPCRSLEEFRAAMKLFME